MKKFIKLGLIAMIIGSFILTQQSHAQFLSYGIKGGLNIANVGGSDVEEADARTGFHIGGFLGVSLLGLAAFEGGVYFSQKGFQIDDASFEQTITYIDIPVVAKLSFLPFTHLYAGPQLSFLVDNKTSFGGISTSSTEGMSKTDLAAVIGVGMNLPMGLRASVGYDFGLTSLDEDGDSDIFNRVVKITVGYRF